MEFAHLPAKSSSDTQRRQLWLGALVVLVLTFAAHVGGLWGQFLQWDDSSHLTQDPAIRELTLANLRLIFTTFIAKLYIPLTLVSFSVDYQIWGRNPFGYHITNLLFHLANTMLVLLLVRQILTQLWQPPSPEAATRLEPTNFSSLTQSTSRALPVAILTAAIFGVHPLRVESVAWVTERKDMLFAFFFLSGLLAYARWATMGRLAGYWCSLGLFLAAALSKSTAVTFPVVLLLLDEFVYHRRRRPEKIPFFIGSILIGTITVVAQASGSGDTVVPTIDIPIWARAGLMGYCSLFYVRKFFWPFHLTAIYPTFDEMNWQLPQSAAWLLALLAICGAIFALRRRAPLLLPCWLFYLITLSPTIGLVPAGIHVVADRFSYLPLIGLALPVSVGLVSCGRRVWALVIVGVIGLTLLADARTAVWRNTETLFGSVLQEYPKSYPALLNMTVWYTSVGRTDEAIAIGQRAVAAAPEGLIGRRNLARAFIKAHRYREAVVVLRPAIEHGVNDFRIWEDMHECFVALGDYKNARAVQERMAKMASAPPATQ